MKSFPIGTQLMKMCTCWAVSKTWSLVEQYQVEEIILAASAISSREKMLEIFKRYGVDDRVNVRMSSGLYEIITTGLSVKEYAYVPLVGVNKVRLTGIDRFMKFVLDYVLTVPGLIVLSPLLLLVALIVRLDSPGPIIHRRRVMGVNGTHFDAYKFRTMRVNGDEILEQYPDLKEELARTHKLKWDPRITRVGSFLRRYSLDELPQLFNVLKREMSLVGPRMISPAEIEQYDHWDINLLTVQPGITGLWQVSGRSDISYDQRVRLDMHYIRNWSIWLDLQLLIQTIPAVIKSRGAY
jgi:exopolysaccharide biosynthesis polyprenyl glycosylphosphotransferase